MMDRDTSNEGRWAELRRRRQQFEERKIQNRREEADRAARLAELERRLEQRFAEMQNSMRWSQQQGLSENQIKKLNHEKMTPKLLKDKNLAEDNCSVCLDSFQSDQIVRTLQTCSHTFHKSCIDLWLVKSNSCPNCKREVAASSDHIENRTLR